jgi:uncharacterized protein YodC (DUF2158 family)
MSEAPKFAVGDLVRVRLPQAPTMVVYDVAPPGPEGYVVRCLWFDTEARACQAAFDARVLALLPVAE